MTDDITDRARELARQYARDESWPIDIPRLSALIAAALQRERDEALKERKDANAE
jgi:hypothetical protein